MNETVNDNIQLSNKEDQRLSLYSYHRAKMYGADQSDPFWKHLYQVVRKEELIDKAHGHLQWRWSVYIAAGFPLLLLAVSAIFINALMLAKFCRTRRILSVNLHITFSLTAADLWAVLLVTIGLLVNSVLPALFRKDLLEYTNLNCFLLLIESLKLSAILTSVLHLVALGLNQCFSIVDPLMHKVAVTTSKCKKVLSILWILPVIGFLTSFSITRDQGFRSTKCRHLWYYQMQSFRTFVFCLIAVPMILMVVIYSIILFKLRRSEFRRLSTSQNKFRCSRDDSGQNYKRQMHTFVTTVIIVGSFVVGWFPSILLYLLVCWDCAYKTYLLSEKLIVALSITKTALCLTKLLLNPVIYSWRFGSDSRCLREDKNCLMTTTKLHSRRSAASTGAAGVGRAGTPAADDDDEFVRLCSLKSFTYDVQLVNNYLVFKNEGPAAAATTKIDESGKNQIAAVNRIIQNDAADRRSASASDLFRIVRQKGVPSPSPSSVIENPLFAHKKSVI